MPLYDESHNLNKAADVQIKAETISPNNILTEIDQNLPAKVCPAHNLLVTYIQDMNKTLKDEIQSIDGKLDKIMGYMNKEQGKNEEKGKNNANKTRRILILFSAAVNIVSSIILAYVFIYLRLK
jgi:Na+-translocating ferredoxin:NAD+ oxidoreductase RnfC subunit